MSSADNRLKRLRALVDGLERLPASARREWMLAEARARVVDVETGEPARAMRPLATEPQARLGDQPRPQIPKADASKRPTDDRSEPPRPESPAQDPEPSATPRGANGHVDASRTVDETGDQGAFIASLDERTAAPDLYEVMWADDSKEDAADGDAEAKPRPWRRGLRG